jgi:cell division protein FtsB
MFSKIKNNKTIKMLFDTRNLGLYILVIITLSVTWSSIKVIQKNYALEKQISTLEQQVDVTEQENKNLQLKNEYYKTDTYLDLAARKYFGKATAGESYVLVPKEVSAKYTHPEIAKEESITVKPKIVQNWQDWINFFLHKTD